MFIENLHFSHGKHLEPPFPQVISMDFPQERYRQAPAWTHLAQLLLARPSTAWLKIVETSGLLHSTGVIHMIDDNYI